MRLARVNPIPSLPVRTPSASARADSGEKTTRNRHIADGGGCAYPKEYAKLSHPRFTYRDIVSQRIRSLFHFTDRRNLSSIEKHGGLFSCALLNEKGIEIPAPGGNDWSHQADAYKGMDRYVHLCFRPTHPMEHNARIDGRIVSSIFLNIHTDVLKIADVKFTAGVSNKSDVETYSIEEAMEIIDFDMLYGGWKDWNDPGVQARLQQVEKYEILVPDHIPFNLILNFPHG
jgi:hypothetical protein